MRRTMRRGQALVDWRIGSHTVAPVAHILDELASGFLQRRPAFRMTEQINDAVRQRTRITGLEQHACIAVLDQLAVSADIGRHKQALLCHCFKRL